MNKPQFIPIMQYCSKIVYELSKKKKTWRKLKCVLPIERTPAVKNAWLPGVTFWKEQNCRDNKIVSSSQELCRENRDKYVEHKGFLGYLKYYA